MLAVAAIGAVISAVYAYCMGGTVSETLEVIPGMPESVTASVAAFHAGMGRLRRALSAPGGVLGLLGIRNPRRVIRCEDCAEGAYSVQAPHSPIGVEAAPASRELLIPTAR